MADIETLEGIPWSSKAAAMDASARVDHKQPFLAIWVDDDGSFHWSKANMTFTAMALIAACVSGMLTKWTIRDLEDAE